MELRNRFKLYLVLVCVGLLGISELYLSLDFRFSDLLPEKEVGLWEYQPTFDNSRVFNHFWGWEENWCNWKEIVPRTAWKDSIDVRLGYFPPTKDLFGILVFSNGKKVYSQMLMYGDGITSINIPTDTKQVDIFFINRTLINEAVQLPWKELQDSELVYKHDQVILDMDRNLSRIECTPYGDIEVWYWTSQKRNS